MRVASSALWDSFHVRVLLVSSSLKSRLFPFYSFVFVCVGPRLRIEKHKEKRRKKRKHMPLVWPVFAPLCAVRCCHGRARRGGGRWHGAYGGTGAHVRRCPVTDLFFFRHVYKGKKRTAAAGRCQATQQRKSKTRPI